MSTEGKSPSNKIILIVAALIALAALVYLMKNKKVGTSGQNSESTHALYEKNCAACHRADGGGAAGPNLTDDFWIYGKAWADVEDFIAKGNEAGGMPAYQNTLRPEEIRELTEYIRSLQGSNPPNPKAPQGFGYKMPVDAK